MTKYDMFEKLIDNLGIEQTLYELIDALSDDEVEENYEYIARMHDIEEEEE